MPQRYEQEIEKLLQRLDLSPRRRRRRSILSKLKPRRPLRLRPVNLPLSGEIMMASYALTALSFFLRYLSFPLSKYLALAAAILFLGAYLLSFLPLTPSHPRHRKVWRGRVID